MTADPMVATGSSAGSWFRGRPRSWPFFVVTSALAAALLGAPILVFHRPGTRVGWVAWFLISWAVFVCRTLFRNPIYENQFARSIAARTDSNASGARVIYLLVVFLGILIVFALASFGVSTLVASLHRS
jgi:hypothetical protein